MESWDIRAMALDQHHPQVLSSDEEMRVIALNLPAGEVLQEHQVHERALLVVVDGEIEVVQGSESITGGSGFTAQWKPTERREINATTDARLLLILAPWPGEGHPSRPTG